MYHKSFRMDSFRSVGSIYKENTKLNSIENFVFVITTGLIGNNNLITSVLSLRRVANYGRKLKLH